MIMFSLLFWRIMSSFFSAFSFPTFSSSFIYQFFLLLYFCLQFSGKENIIFELIKEILHFFYNNQTIGISFQTRTPISSSFTQDQKGKFFLLSFSWENSCFVPEKSPFFFSFSLLGELVLLKKVSSLCKHFSLRNLKPSDFGKKEKNIQLLLFSVRPSLQHRT